MQAPSRWVSQCAMVSPCQNLCPPSDPTYDSLFPCHLHCCPQPTSRPQIAQVFRRREPRQHEPSGSFLFAKIEASTALCAICSFQSQSCGFPLGRLRKPLLSTTSERLSDSGSRPIHTPSSPRLVTQAAITIVGANLRMGTHGKCLGSAFFSGCDGKPRFICRALLPGRSSSAARTLQDSGNQEASSSRFVSFPRLISLVDVTLQPKRRTARIGRCPRCVDLMRTHGHLGFTFMDSLTFPDFSAEGHLLSQR